MNSTNAGPDSLKQSLQQLHAELSRASIVDESSRQKLRELLAEIEGRLNESAAPNSAAPHRLEAAAVQFEAGHPALAASVRQFIGLLSQAGL
jgi:hypothetical protein